MNINVNDQQTAMAELIMNINEFTGEWPIGWELGFQSAFYFFMPQDREWARNFASEITEDEETYYYKHLDGRYQVNAVIAELDAGRCGFAVILTLETPA